MYRKEDIEAINLNIDNIKDEAEYECRTKNDPTLEEMSNVYGDIMDYIRTNNVIAYGGFAQNLLIGVKDKEKELKLREDALNTGSCNNYNKQLLDLQNENKFKREVAERAALNAPIQGTAADIIKLAMLLVDKAMKEANLRSRLLLQIHDELLFEYVDSELNELIELVKREMGAAYPLKVALSVNIGYGRSWHAAEH